MERITSFPWGTLTLSAISTTVALVLILVFGAPAWTLLPITLGGATLYIEMSSWVRRRHERLR